MSGYFEKSTKSGGTADDSYASVLYRFYTWTDAFYMKGVIIVQESDWQWQRIKIKHTKLHNERGENENEKNS